MTAEDIIALGYVMPRLLPTGEWAALHRYAFTVGLCVGLDETGYRTRFCFQSVGDALGALIRWDGQGDPCGAWIKEKGRRERHNPRHFYGIPVVMEVMERS